MTLQGHITISYWFDRDDKIVLVNNMAFSDIGHRTVKVYELPEEIKRFDDLLDGPERTVFTFMEKPETGAEIIETCFRHWLNSGDQDDR